ncbi:MAG TPA: RHS repeat-associated core domain-containing protein [Candidatus Acidoferrales bacterium]|nr:RHS repeat-associated core domain-containing protein [Candidatus Acidoferrales bacterium]
MSIDTTYTYNAENEMTSTAGVNYTYDGDGNRVEKNNGTLYWYGVSGDPLEETSLSGGLTNDYVFFGGQRIARRDPSGNTFAYFDDHLGSSRKVEEVASGASSASLSYDADFYPFGRENAFTNTSNPIHKFTGKQRDSESGLDDFGARYYSSNIGRFMSPDPTILSVTPSNPQTWNRYTYVLNNPSTDIDTNGKWLPFEHDRIINDVFSFMSDGDRAILKQASAYVDEDQTEQGAPKHGMTNPDCGGKNCQAQAMTDAANFIDTNINQAVAAQLAWEDSASSPAEESVRETLNAPKALYFFGEALHTVTDEYSPEHAGFQNWHGADAPFDVVHGNDLSGPTGKNMRLMYHGAMEGVASMLAFAAQHRAEEEARMLWLRYQDALKEARKKRGQKKPKPKNGTAPSAMAGVETSGS